jgi:hypothetical protein
MITIGIQARTYDLIYFMFKIEHNGIQHNDIHKIKCPIELSNCLWQLLALFLLFKRQQLVHTLLGPSLALVQD